MFKILSRQLIRFSTTKPYERYLNDHIKKTLQAVSTPGKIKSRESCEKYFEHLLSSNQAQPTIKSTMNMIFSAAFQLQNFEEQRQVVCKMIVDKNIKSQSQLDRVVKFLFKEIKWNSTMGKQEIERFLMELDEKNKQFQVKVQCDVKDKKIQFNQKNLNNLCKKYRQIFPQIDSKFIYDTVSSKIQSIKNQQHQNTPNQVHSMSGPVTVQTKTIEQNKFWHKIQNIKPRLIKQQLNTPEIFQQHKSITQGRLRFRFPPQPNGYLHIGHVKSIRMNFQTAKRLNGQCYLRYDDTNPEKETHEFIQEIERNVRWMGYTPDKVNFTSDYFEQMLEFANKLVKEGKAYVCESSQDEIQSERKQKRTNPFRIRQKQFSQKIFPHLNPYQTLRLKLDPTSANPTLRDPIIYRFKPQPHPKTGTKYKIYPMYDFAHCISDSLEHIDYSLCSLEFQIRRQLYYRILDMLGLYKPIVWQFSRLNVTGNVISKRKIKQLIDDGKIQGWDDPRLLTIKGMQRRGYTPGILNEFIDKVNASRSGNEKYVRFEVLQKEMKKQLAKKCVKVMALKNPVKVYLNNQHSINLTKQQQKISDLSFIHVQKQELEQIPLDKQLILKQAGVYSISLNQSTYKLHPSTKSIQQLKTQHQKPPILSWLPESITYKKVVYFGPLVNENEEYIEGSRREDGVWVSEECQVDLEQKKKAHDLEKVFFFERIGYFKRDQKTGELICCTQL